MSNKPNVNNLGSSKLEIPQNLVNQEKDPTTVPAQPKPEAKKKHDVDDKTLKTLVKRFHELRIDLNLELFPSKDSTELQKQVDILSKLKEELSKLNFKEIRDLADVAKQGTLTKDQLDGLVSINNLLTSINKEPILINPRQQVSVPSIPVTQVSPQEAEVVTETETKPSATNSGNNNGETNVDIGHEPPKMTHLNPEFIQKLGETLVKTTSLGPEVPVFVKDLLEKKLEYYEKKLHTIELIQQLRSQLGLPGKPDLQLCTKDQLEGELKEIITELKKRELGSQTRDDQPQADPPIVYATAPDEGVTVTEPLETNTPVEEPQVPIPPAVEVTEDQGVIPLSDGSVLGTIPPIGSGKDKVQVSKPDTGAPPVGTAVAADPVVPPTEKGSSWGRLAFAAIIIVAICIIALIAISRPKAITNFVLLDNVSNPELVEQLREIRSRAIRLQARIENTPWSNTAVLPAIRQITDRTESRIGQLNLNPTPQQLEEIQAAFESLLRSLEEQERASGV